MIDINTLRKERDEAIRKILSWPNDGWEEEVIRFDRLLLLGELKELRIWDDETLGNMVRWKDVNKLIQEHEGSGDGKTE